VPQLSDTHIVSQSDNKLALTLVIALSQIITCILQRINWQLII